LASRGRVEKGTTAADRSIGTEWALGKAGGPTRQP
jgi:hypothetical protein